MQAIIFIVNMVYTIIVTVIRFGHPGKVCAGDYLYTTDAEIGDEKRGVLAVEA